MPVGTLRVGPGTAGLGAFVLHRGPTADGWMRLLIRTAG
jgi:hypothetical protein